MRDNLRDLRGEDETGWGLEVPPFDHGHRWGSLPSVVEFQRVKLRGIVAQIIAGFQSLRIEATEPAIGGEGARSDSNVCHNRGILYWDTPCFSEENYHSHYGVVRRVGRIIRTKEMFNFS